MLERMRRDGVRTYSFIDMALLFAYQERDTEAPAPGMPDATLLRWWQMMAPYMETNPDQSPVRESVEEMFHFE
jgi:L-rhamnose mutarotase